MKRVELLLEEILEQRFVKVRKLARVAGMVGSFYLAMGNVTRFHMRGMMSHIAMVVDRYGWNGSLRIEDRVVPDLEFWRRNLRDLNGWEMRISDTVVYCRDGQVEMFSDASDLQVGGARFYGERVAWDTVFKGALAEEERKKSSIFRELRGIEFWPMEGGCKGRW